MRLITPDSLHYPITVTRLLRQTDDDVRNTDPLFDYVYKTTVIEGTDENKEGVLVEKSFPSTFQSYAEGKLEKWLVQPGMVIARSRTPLVDIEEPCRHEVQFAGMCANCGKDMTTVDYNTVTRDTARATVNTVHGHTELLVSPAEASRSDEEAKRRLISSRKLSLVVDLDQTIIHATVDPTVGEWQSDTSNPNYEAVKEVRAFQLADDAPGARGCWYYIKLRPGLQDFLKVISKAYECHIYTMGTRAYAKNIAKIVDPEGKIFGDRILSRDESGSMTVKNLKRLFPVDTRMVVIIDDRGDVWHWSQNLVKVTPYDFFVGIGDINSSFLPKRPGIDVLPPPPPPPPPAAAAPVFPPQISNGQSAAHEETTTSDEITEGQSRPKKPSRPVSEGPIDIQANGEVSAIEQLMSMGGSNDASKLQEQTTAQDETLVAQLTDRPLLQKQKILDAAEESAINGEGTAEEAHIETAEANNEHHSKYRHNLLEDRDTELQYLQQSLQDVHDRFFDEYDRRNKGTQGGRISQLRPGPPKKRSLDDLENLPDVTTVMAGMKQRVLQGVSLVFTGVVPLGVDIQSHDLAIWAKSFGATVSDNITKRTTHVIASPQRRTAKVRQAAKRPERISIVTQQWLFDSLSRWQHVPETPYKIHSEILTEEGSPPNGPTNAASDATPFDEPAEAGLLSSSEDDAALTEDDTDKENPPGTSLSVRTPFDNSKRDFASTEDEGAQTDSEELEKHLPMLSREDSSPHEETHEDWNDMNDELAEFLGSDADDDTDAADTDVEERTGSGSKKRKRTATGSRDGESEDGTGSRLQKRKREALGRTSSLNDPGGGAGETDDDFEKELAAEMARQDDDEDDDDDDEE